MNTDTDKKKQWITPTITLIDKKEYNRRINITKTKNNA